MTNEHDFMLNQDEAEIQDLLDTLTDLRAQRDTLALPYTEKIAALQEDMAEVTEALEEQITAIRKAIRRAIIAYGESVKSEHARATYVAPRVTWDTKRLEGYAEAHPEIKTFRREGKPSVRITFTE